MITSALVLDFTFKLLQPGVRPKLVEYVINRKTSAPLVVEIDTTTVCNYRCPDCINADLLNRGQIESHRLEQLLHEFKRAGVRAVIFIGGGEPLAHPSMPLPLIETHEIGMQVGLTTNGSLINQCVNEIAEHTSWTRVSVDAATQKTYSIVRPSRWDDSFSLVISNMEKLASLKKGLLGFSFLIVQRTMPDGTTMTNCDEILDAAILAKNIGCDYFEFKPSVDSDHHLIPFSKACKDSLLRQMPRLNELNMPGFSVVFPKSINHLLHERNPDQPKTYRTCPSLEFRTVVSPNGIYPCPYKRGKKHIGGISERFDQYWRSEARKANSEAIDPSNECPFYCIRHESNLLLSALADNFDKGIDLLPYLLETECDDAFI